MDFAPTDGLNYDLSIAYSEADSDLLGTDILTQRFDQAVNGVGGPNCPRVSETANSADNDAIRGDSSVAVIGSIQLGQVRPQPW